MADQTFQNVVNGKLTDAKSGETYDVLDPTTGEVYAQAQMSGPEDIDAAYAAAAAAFEGWGDTTPSERQKALLKIADALEERADEFVRAESKDTGKPLGLTTSEELPPGIDQIRFFAGAARVLEGRSAGEYMTDHTSMIRREPIGVIGQVTPWNYPLMMMIWKIAPALAAGNTIVLKPSDTTPASSVLLGELCQEFLPPGVLNIVTGDRDTGRALVEHETPQMVAITGSIRAGVAGRRVRRQAAQAGAPRARRQGAGHRVRRRRHREGRVRHRRGRLLQRRPGLHRRHPRARRPRRARRLRRRADRAGQGGQDRPAGRRGRAYGPLNNPDQLARVTGMVDRLPDHARLETGGHRQGEAGYFYEPTVLSGLQQDDEQIQDEIFGPVITVQKFSDEARGAAPGPTA